MTFKSPNRTCEGLLLDYAAGTLDEAHTLLVEAHLMLCPTARCYVTECEAVGGALIEHLCDPVTLDAGCLDALLKKIDAPSEEDVIENKDQAPNEDCARFFYNKTTPSLDRLFIPLMQDARLQGWRVFGSRWVSLLEGTKGVQARLVRLRPGRALPIAIYRETSAILVVEGCLACDKKEPFYTQGHILFAGEDFEAPPVADKATGCVVLHITAT